MKTRNIFRFNLITILNTFILVTVMAFFSACDDTDEPTPVPEPENSRTLLVYMAADNNLSSYAMLDIQEMKEGLKNVAGAKNKRLLVYLAYPKSEYNKMIELLPDGSIIDIKEFQRGDNLTISRMREVFALMKEYAPAEHYGLVLWSHGTGWLNDNGVIDDPDDIGVAGVQLKSWGYDNIGKKKMRITALAQALSDVEWEYVYFDCCHMACVEVAYELRHVTPLIVGSPTELGVDGMPYHKNVECLLAGSVGLTQAVENTYRSYADGEIISGNEGCAISLIRTDGLERLAELTRTVYAGNPQPAKDYYPVPYFRTAIMSSGIYDMWHYIEALTDDAQLFEQWREAYTAVVPLAFATPTVYRLDATNFHGLGTQIVNKMDDADVYDYRTTSWWNDVVKSRFD